MTNESMNEQNRRTLNLKIGDIFLQKCPKESLNADESEILEYTEFTFLLGQASLLYKSLQSSVIFL